MPPNVPAAVYLNSVELLRDPSHQRALSQSEWEALFSAARLQVVHVEKAVLTHAFLPWVNRQGCTSQTIAQLAEMFRQAPPEAQSWCQSAGFEGDLTQAMFYAPHILIIGRKL